MSIQNETAWVPLHRMPMGERSFGLAWLSERTSSSTRHRRPFFVCRFRDACAEATCMIWSDSPWFVACSNWKVGQAFGFEAALGQHEKYGLQIELFSIEPVQLDDSYKQFMPAHLELESRFSVPVMWDQLLHRVQTEIADVGLIRLVLTLLNRYEVALKLLPASDGKFYPFRGGWLEHVVHLWQSCQWLVDHYRTQYAAQEPELNRDLVLAGVVLHDIGRVLEWKVAPDGTEWTSTVPGKLFGHVLLGRDLVRATATELQCVQADVLERLEHIILSHLALPEWGSPRLPMIPEVLILHHADDLDAKLEMYMRCYRKDQQPGPFTARDPVLNKPLLKQGAWPDARVESHPLANPNNGQ